MDHGEFPAADQSSRNPEGRRRTAGVSGTFLSGFERRLFMATMIKQKTTNRLQAGTNQPESAWAWMMGKSPWAPRTDNQKIVAAMPTASKALSNRTMTPI